MRFVKLVALVLLVVPVLAGCGSASTIEPVDQALAAAGFTSVDVELGPVEAVGDVASVTAVPPADLPAEQGYDTVAKIVWTTLPVRIDGLQVELDGENAAIKRAGLEQLLGPRNPELDKRTIADTTASSAIAIAVVGAVALLVVVGLVLLLVRASRKRRADALLRGQYGPQPGPYPPPPGGPYPPGFGPPPGPQQPPPGYQQPPAGL